MKSLYYKLKETLRYKKKETNSCLFTNISRSNQLVTGKAYLRSRGGIMQLQLKLILEFFQPTYHFFRFDQKVLVKLLVMIMNMC